jgi:WD40 repeat protein
MQGQRPAPELRLLRVLKSDYVINRLAWHPDNTELAAAQNLNKRVTIWNIQTGKVARILDQEAGGVGALAYSPDGEYLAAGRTFTRHVKGGSFLHIYNSASGRVVRDFVPPPPRERDASDVNAMSVSPDGRYVAVNGYGGQGKGVVYEVSTGRFVTTFGAEHGTVGALAFSPDGRLLALGRTVRKECDEKLRRCFLEGRLDMLSTSSWKTAKSIPIPSPNVIHNIVPSITFSSDGRHLAAAVIPAFDGSRDERTNQWVTAAHQGQIKVFDVPSLSEVSSFPSPSKTASICLWLLEKRGGVLAGCAAKSIVWVDTSTGRAVQLLKNFSNLAYTAVSPDRKYLAVGAGREVSVYEFVN